MLSIQSCDNKEDTNEELKEIGKSIELFIDNQLSNYLRITDEITTVDHYVLLGLVLLQDTKFAEKARFIDYYVPSSKMKNYLEKTYYNDRYINNPNIYDIVKVVSIKKAYNFDNTQEKELFNKLPNDDINEYNVCWYMLEAALLNDESKNDLFEDIFDKVITTKDSDTIAMSIYANYIGNYIYNDDLLYDFLASAASETGISTFDYMTNELSTTGNACSTSMSIITFALVNLINYSNRWYSNDYYLVDILISYQNKDGSFSYNISDDPDLDFSSPQAFAALACAYYSIKNQTFTYLF